jgi:hypothetical protein
MEDEIDELDILISDQEPDSDGDDDLPLLVPYEEDVDY